MFKQSSHRGSNRKGAQQPLASPVVQLLMMPVLEPVREWRWIEITYRSSEYFIEEQEVEAD